MLMALTVGLAVAIRMTGNWYRIEAEKQQIEKERTQAELKNLKSQLNPHFLFNTLNNIYALIPIDRTKAQFAVHSLSHMLRYVLYENNQNYIPLEKEIQFVRNYVELMELRLPDRVETTVDPARTGGRVHDRTTAVHYRWSRMRSNTVSARRSRRRAHFDPHGQGRDIGLARSKTATSRKATQTEAVRASACRTCASGESLYPNRHILRTENLNGSFVAQLIIDL